jgi:hypothetical protein
LNAHLSSILAIPALTTTTTTTTTTIPVADIPRSSKPNPGEASEPKDEAAEAAWKEGEEQQQQQEEAFAFRLFSTSAPSQKVVLPSQDDELYVPSARPIAPRPLSHYIRGPLTPLQQEQFRLAAVAGREVVRRARKERAWGLEVPWRVVTVRITADTGADAGAASAKVGAEGEEGSEEPGSTMSKIKKRRPGKKRRIVMRKREKAKREVEAAKERSLVTKEEHLKEKRKRLNREKKLKRRRKEKEKKMAAKGEQGERSEGGSVADG